MTSLDQVEWTNVRDYLVSRGWRKLPVPWEDAGAFRNGGAEVIVPFDAELADYREGLLVAASRIARFENRPVDEVLVDLARPRADHARFARTGEGTSDGTLPIVDAPGFIDGIRRALLAASHTVERPDQRFHRRMSRSAPEELVRACRMGPAEQRSFAIAVHCPLDLPGQLPGTESFGRHTVETLMRSTSRSVRLLRKEGVGAVAGADDVVITANLCEALVAMMPSDERGDLELEVRYSPILAPSEGAPTHVRVERQLFESFDRLGQALRKPEAPVEGTYVGRVRELKGEPNADGRLEGEAVLRLDVEDELIHARCALGPDDYDRAIVAHREQKHVAVRGVLRRTGRTYALDQPRELRVIELP